MYGRWTLDLSAMDEVDSLLQFLKDKKDAISAEVESTLAKLAELEAAKPEKEEAAEKKPVLNKQLSQVSVDASPL